MSAPPAAVLPGHALKPADLPRNGALRNGANGGTDAAATGFDIVLDAKERAAAAGFLRIREIRKARFGGRVIAWRKTGWRLEGRLDAVAVQDCVITLAPVVQRIGEDVVRRFLPEAETITGAGTNSGTDSGDAPDLPAGSGGAEGGGADGDASDEAPDDMPDPVGDRIDLAAVMLEALALALDPYPRARGAELGTAVFAAPGVAPMTDADARPFAKLAALKPKAGGSE